MQPSQCHYFTHWALTVSKVVACLVLQAWVASQFSGFKVQLGDMLSRQLADAMATERTKSDADITQVGS